MFQKNPTTKPPNISECLITLYYFFFLPAFLSQNVQNEGMNKNQAYCLQYKRWLLGRTWKKRNLFRLKALKAIRTFWITSLEAVCNLFQLMSFAHIKPLFCKAP